MALHDYREQERQQAGPVTLTPELDLSLSDSELLDLIDRKQSEYASMLERDKVGQRVRTMTEYFRGKQEVKQKRGMPDKRYNANIIWRDLNTRVQNATSRMPDVVVMSPQQDESPTVKERTRSVEEWLGIRLDSDVTRRLAQRALQDNALKFRGVWAYRYDPVRKDAVIECLRPEDVVLDATARVPEDGYTCDNMEYVGEWCEDFTATVLDRFPDKSGELLAQISREKAAGNKPASSKLRYLKSTARVTRRDGSAALVLIYSYDRILLSKAPHPYWDEREGSEESFGIIPEDRLHPEVSAMLPVLGLKDPAEEARYAPRRFNHFPFPRMPYTLMVGRNLGEGPIESTTVVEQAIPLQDIVNNRGDQITQINDWAIPKTAIATGAMTEAKASKISRDPSEIITAELREGQGIDNVIKTFSGEPAHPALYQDLQANIQLIDSFFSTQAAVRGEAVEPESGISKQISREGDLSTTDDIAQTMVQRAVEEAANWLVQLAKIYFDEPRSASAYGPDRTLRKASVSRDLIPDDLQVVVKANAVDKMTMRNMALNLVTSQGIDPYNLYQFLDFPNPKEMTVDLVNFLRKDADGGASYLQSIGANPSLPGNQQNEAEASAPQAALQPAPSPQPPAPPGPPAPPQAPAPPGNIQQ